MSHGNFFHGGADFSKKGADFFEKINDFLKNLVDFFSWGVDFLARKHFLDEPVAPVAFLVARIRIVRAPVIDNTSIS